MAKVKIEVAELEYDEGSHTLWVHSPRGMTVLRLKTTGKIVTHLTQGVSSHCDINVSTDIDVFVADADRPK